MDLNNIYTEVILEHSRNSRNKKELSNPTFVEPGNNPSCGDEITLQLKGNEDKIEDASYTGTGCAISQASTSIMIDTIKNHSYKEALEMANNFIGMIKNEVTDQEELDKLGDAIIFENIKNLPARVKCAVLPWYTLKNVIEKNNKDK